MRATKVLLDFVKLSPPEKVVFYKNVMHKMTGNPLFMQPYISISELKLRTDNLEIAILNAQDGARTAISDMHDKEILVDKAYRIMASYVEHMANGDETTILSAGFNITKQPNLPHKQILTATYTDHSGEVKLVSKVIDKAVAYIWQYAMVSLITNELVWTTSIINTHSNHLVHGLIVGVQYYFRVAAVTPTGVTDFCEPVLKRVV